MSPARKRPAAGPAPGMHRASPRPAAADPAGPEDPFPRLAERLRRDGLVDPADGAPGRLFGATALKVRGKIFAMSVDGAVVLKLPAARVAALIAAGRGRPFEPSPGRRMKEWIVLGPGERELPGLAREAHAHVGGTR